MKRASAAAGIPVEVDRIEAHMHHRFAIFDGARLISGSYNWTGSACDQARGVPAQALRGGCKGSNPRERALPMAIGAAFCMNLHSGMENMPTWMYWAIFAAGIFMGVLLRGWVKAPVAPPVVAQPSSTLKKK
jgi:hypothetical protein